MKIEFCSALVLALLLIAHSDRAYSQWSDNAAVNLGVVVKPGEQVLPKVASTSGGGTYVGWFDNVSGNYDVYLQLLDADGVKQFSAGGLLVSDHPSMSSLVDWDVIADAQGNAVLVFADIRNGGDLDVYAYRISPDEEFLWGANGITLSNNVDFEPAPRITETSDGNFTAVWARLPDAGDGTMIAQKLTPTGEKLFGNAGITILGLPGEAPGFVNLAAADNGGFILSWVRDISSFLSLRHIHAQKFDTDGNAVWPDNPLVVFDAASVPIAHQPMIEPDGSGGAVIAWHRAAGNVFNSFVQHVESDGTERFAHNGLEVSLNPNLNHIDPAMVYNAQSDEIFVFWNERSLNQDMWGIYGQRFAGDGQRLWGAAGKQFMPVNNIYKSFPRAGLLGDGAVVAFFDEPTGSVVLDRVLAIGVDANGDSIWPASPTIASSLLSGKARLPITVGEDGITKLFWEDNRNGTVDLYAQNINPDGTLGIVTAEPGDVNGDSVVDLQDYEIVAGCLAGPQVFTPPLGCSEESFAASDLESDDDVDARDVAMLMGLFTAP